MLKYKILGILFIISLIASAMLAFAPNGETCNVEETCDAVQVSKQASTFGIKNCHYGVAIFLFLTFLSFSQIKRPTKIKAFIINLGVLIGFLVALYFLYTMFFVLKSFCQYCLAVDISMVLAFLTLLFYYRKRRKWYLQK